MGFKFSNEKLAFTLIRKFFCIKMLAKVSKRFKGIFLRLFYYFFEIKKI
jgi:hypothetical protein